MALVSVVRTTPSLHTTPIVVVNSKRLSLLILGFPTCRVIQLFLCYIVAFRETERFDAEPVSDGLKTFSEMIERSNRRVDDLSFIGRKQF